MSEVSDDTTLAAGDGSDATTDLYGCIAGDSLGQTVLHPTREQYVDVIKTLADEGFTLVIDLCGVDYLQHMRRPLPAGVVPERFEVVVNLLDITHRRRIRVRVQVPDSDPTLPSLFDVHPGSEAYERETYDMFGVVFTDHPDMTRILMPEDWDGHPLRKDYAVGTIPVQFKGANS
ncbi:MAG: NADH-quinone oxidoreductase subunit C [Ilumatobacteraceae bacterium]|nr:NADH-quinone oxidoreductase subunit C [Ilumatobacteraceae bacterium]